MSFKSLINTSTRLRVSSVLNKETRVYGKQFLADGKEETCWSSDPCEDGSYQWILVNFEKPEEVSSLEIKFQGGFASSEVVVEVMLDGRFKPVKSLYPEDVNSSQVFDLEGLTSDCYRFKFEKLTDFFGRVIVYSFQMYGRAISDVV